MPEHLKNPHRGPGLRAMAPLPPEDPGPVLALLQHCPKHAETPLVALPDLAQAAGIRALWAKDERSRMGLGSFKALGAAYAIAHDAAHDAAYDTGGAMEGEMWATALQGRTYVTASAGNHGLSVAAGARLFGASATIFLAETVPEAFAERLHRLGARTIRAGATYEDSITAASEAAEREGWTLLSDSSWPGYTTLPYRVMEGYLQMAAEAADQVPEPPTHIVLQAGVGGMAAAVAAYARVRWGAGPTITIVEPKAAPALIESIRAGHIVDTEGPVSSTGRLDCKTPSMIALAGLSRDADAFVTISEEEAEAGAAALASHGIATTPSGAAGLAALLAGLPGMDAEARVLVFVTEGPEGG